MGMAKHGPRVAALKNSKKLFEGGVEIDPRKGAPAGVIKGAYEDVAEAARPKGSAARGRAPFAVGKG